MEIKTFDVPGIVLIKPTVFTDERGSFYESYHVERFAAAGIAYNFSQDNRSVSRKGVLRGLHYQIGNPQGHLVTLTRGYIFDIGLDLRRKSPTFGSWLGFELTADPPVQLFLPPGVAHGFCVLSDEAEIWYKCTHSYVPHDEGGVLWNDPDLGITWPVSEPIVSARDAAFPRLADISENRLPNLT